MTTNSFDSNFLVNLENCPTELRNNWQASSVSDLRLENKIQTQHFETKNDKSLDTCHETVHTDPIDRPNEIDPTIINDSIGSECPVNTCSEEITESKIQLSINNKSTTNYEENISSEVLTTVKEVIEELKKIIEESSVEKTNTECYENTRERINAEVNNKSIENIKDDQIQISEEIMNNNRFIGLPNIGNTCYMNTALQVSCI